MKILSDSTLQWWREKSAREQKLLILLIVLVSAAVAYVGVVAPVVNRYRDAQLAHQTADEGYRWLQDQGRLLNRLRSEAGGVLPIAKPAKLIKGQITAELDKINVKNTTEIVKKGEEELVKIAIEKAPGTKFMRWLESLSLGGKRIVEADLENRKGFLFGTIVVGG